jgi:hypothetical protein
VLSWAFEFVSPRSNFILIGSVAALLFPLFTISVFVTKLERMYPTCTLSRQSFVLRRLVGLRSGRRKRRRPNRADRLRSLLSPTLLAAKLKKRFG